MTAAAPGTGPLAGLTVIDCSAVLSGPLATAMLAEQGATVIKVEPPEGDTTRLIGPAKGGLSAMYVAANRGKRVLVLDLKQPEARDIVLALVARADVLVQNMRPGVMERLGLGPGAALARNPRLVYLSITGFGPDGPDAGARVYDGVVQARAGLCAANPHPTTGEPMLLPSALCDKLTALTAAQAVCSALLERARTGRGQHVQLSMIDAALAFQWPDAQYNHVFVDDAPPAMPEFMVGQRPWAVQDGHVVTNVPQQAEFDALCRVLGCPELSRDERFASTPARMRHGAELRAALAPRFAARRLDELLPALAEAGVPAGRVRLPRAAARFDGHDGHPQPAPQPREHTRELLRELGWDDARIDDAVRRGVAFEA